VAMLLTDDGCVDYVGGALLALGPGAHLPLIEVKISGPHGAGQYLRRPLSVCFLDFDHYRCRVDFRLCLSARCGNVIESRLGTAVVSLWEALAIFTSASSSSCQKIL